MGNLIELVAGEGNEFRMLLDSTPDEAKKTLNSSMQSYISPRSAFSFTLTHENNPNLFKFIRAYKPLKLNPDVLRYISKSEEQLRAYGAMLGFSIAHLIPENLPKEELNKFVKICEKIILLGGGQELINYLGKAFLSLQALKEKTPIPGADVQTFENALLNSTSIEQVLRILKEIVKVNRIASPKSESRWHFFPQQA